jgi:hypothetical protein
MFTYLTLTNFTAFEHWEMEFSQGINVFIEWYRKNTHSQSVVLFAGFWNR